MSKTKFDDIINDMVKGAESNYGFGIKNLLQSEMLKTSLNTTSSSDETNTEEEIEIIDNLMTTTNKELIDRYGIRQEIVIKSKKEDSNLKARRILTEHCKPTEEITVKCIGDTDYRVGFGVHVILPFLSKYYDCFMYVKEVEHEWLSSGLFTSILTLTPSRVMDQQEWTDTDGTGDEDDEEGSGGLTNSEIWEKIYAVIKQQIGKPYSSQPSAPETFDCSLLVQYCYNQYSSDLINGEPMKRVTWEQQTQGVEVGCDSSSDIQNNCQPGDLLFWVGSHGTKTKSGHVSIYTGNNKMIHAPQTGDVVKEVSISRTDLVCVRRVIPEMSESCSSVGDVSVPNEYYEAKKATVESNVSTFLSNMNQYGYKNTIIKVAKEYGLDPYLVAGIIAAESEGIPNCQSSSGANGLMQAKGASFEVEANIKAGCQIYKDKAKAMGTDNMLIVLTAYGIGEGNLQKVMKKWNLNNNVSAKELWDCISKSGDIIGSGVASEGKYGACKQIMAMSMLKDKKALS